VSGMPRPLPERPSLRFAKIEAKRRVATGEFPALHAAQAAIAREYGLSSWAAFKQLCAQVGSVSYALIQLQWIIARFRTRTGRGGGHPTPRRCVSTSLIRSLPGCPPMI
jgi:hypothetical protein